MNIGDSKKTKKELTRLAPGVNAFKLQFDGHLLDNLRADYLTHLADLWQNSSQQKKLAGTRYCSEVLGETEDYYLLSYDTYPLFWLTNHSARSRQLFQDFFKQLPLENTLRKEIDITKKAIMYAGFFVIGNRANEPMWHYDYRPGAHAYTLITPLFEWETEHGHLLYKDKEETATYTYALNEAIVFGEGFLHSTEPYPVTDKIRVLVSFTFGTDRWKHWPILKLNIAEQSYYYALPCGHIQGQCQCKKKHHQRETLKSWFGWSK